MKFSLAKVAVGLALAFIAAVAITSCCPFCYSQQQIAPFKTPYGDFTTGIKINGSYGTAGTYYCSSGAGTLLCSAPGGAGIAGLTSDGANGIDVVGGVTSGGAGSFALGVTGPTINGSPYANQYVSLTAAIAATPSGGVLFVPPGTYTLPATTISQPITIEGLGHRQAKIQITGTPNVAITIAASNVTFDNLDISGNAGQLFSLLGQTLFWLTDTSVHGTANQAYAGHCSAALYAQGGSDIWIGKDEFTGDGISPVSGASYEICANYDITSSNYSTARVHVLDSWFHGNLSSFPVTLFNADAPEIRGNTIDQGNNWDGVTEGYGINLYNNDEGNCSSIARTSGAVTCNFTTFPPAMQYPVGAPILVHLGGPGAGGTDFDGVFTVTGSTSNSVSWTQSGVPDDTGGSILPVVNFGFAGARVSSNAVTNVAGNGIYLQSRVSDLVTGNVISKVALQMPDTSLCQGAVSMAGWYLNVTGNTMEDSTKSGICTYAEHSLTSGNQIKGALHFGIYARGARFSNFTGDNIANASPAGIGGDSSTSAVDGTGLSFDNEQINAAPGSAGYFFEGPDQAIAISGGYVKAASSGSASYGILSTNASAAAVTITNVAIDCTADSSSAATFEDGISVAGSHFLVKGNHINGCNHDSSAFGIFEASSGADNVFQLNDVWQSYTGIEVVGTRPHVTLNTLWNNTTPLTCAGTNSSCTMNLLTSTGTFGVSAAQLPTPTGSTLGGVESAAAGSHQFQTGINNSGVPQFAQPAFSDLSGAATSAQLPPLLFVYNSGPLSSIPSTTVGPLMVAKTGQTYHQISVQTNAYTCSGSPQPQIDFYDKTTSGVLAALNIQTTAGQVNGDSSIVVTPTASDQITWKIDPQGATCTLLDIGASVQ